MALYYSSDQVKDSQVLPKGCIPEEAFHHCCNPVATNMTIGPSQRQPSPSERLHSRSSFSVKPACTLTAFTVALKLRFVLPFSRPACCEKCFTIVAIVLWPKWCLQWHLGEIHYVAQNKVASYIMSRSHFASIGSLQMYMSSMHLTPAVHWNNFVGSILCQSIYTVHSPIPLSPKFLPL